MAKPKHTFQESVDEVRRVREAHEQFREQHSHGINDECHCDLRTAYDKVDEIMEDLMVGHNFEYAGTALKKLLCDEIEKAKSGEKQ